METPVLLRQPRRELTCRCRAIWKLPSGSDQILEKSAIMKNRSFVSFTNEDVVNCGVKTSMLCSESGEGTAIELVEPLDGNPPVSQFLAKRGEGVHHICFLVDDVGASLRALEKEGLRLTGEHPRPGSCNCKVAFMHPKSADGALVELAEKVKERAESICGYVPFCFSSLFS